MEFAWILVVTLILLTLQRLVFKKWGLHAVRYERYFNVESCFVGDEVILIEQLSNNKLLPVPWLRLESLFTTGIKFQKQLHHEISEGGLLQNHKSLFSLASYTKVIRRHQVLCVKRGCYKLHSVSLTHGDIIGAQFPAQVNKLDALLLVFPALLPMDTFTLPYHSLYGDIIVRRWIMEDPFIAAGVREYMPGDPLTRVVGSSRVDLQACKLEYSIVSPK